MTNRPGQINDEALSRWRVRAEQLGGRTEHHEYEVELLLAQIYSAICDTPWHRLIARMKAMNIAEEIEREHQECCGTEPLKDIDDDIL